MKGILLNLLGIVSLCIMITGCDKIGKSKNSIADGQLRGVSIGAKYTMPRPFGMVYVPSGTFHMGPSDEDISYAFTARNKQVSMNGFWMDATEITNDEYRQFVFWVRDSIAANILNFKKQMPDGSSMVDWLRAKNIKWNDPKIQEQLNALFVTPDNRINGRKELDAKKIIYHSETFD